MSKPKKHHYVPVSYLRYFASGKNKDKIIVGDKLKAEPYETNIRNIASEKNFYRVDTKDDPLYWEYFYSKEIEASIPRVLGGLIARTNIATNSSVILTDKMKYEIGKLICVQLIRTRKARNHFYKIGTREKDKVFNNLIKLYPTILGKDQYEFLINYEFNEEVYKSLELPLLNDPIRVEKFINILIDRTWVVYKNVNYRKFPYVTSDHPVIMYNITNGSTDFADNGLKKPQTVIGFPVSKDVSIMLYTKDMFFSSMEEYKDKLFVLDDIPMVFKVNQLQYKQCNRQFYFSLD